MTDVIKHKIFEEDKPVQVRSLHKLGFVLLCSDPPQTLFKIA